MTDTAVTTTTASGARAGILVGGLIAATFDLVYAFIANSLQGVSPLRTLHSVASGLLGSNAYEGGVAAGGVGLVSHYAIVIAAAALYYVASRRIPLLHTRPLLSGAIFGVGVYLFMNFVVLPLSAVPFELSYPSSRLLAGFISHATLVGIPIAVAIRHYAYGRPGTA